LQNKTNVGRIPSDATKSAEPPSFIDHVKLFNKIKLPTMADSNNQKEGKGILNES